ncbi:MAG: AI-2E family transporter [Cyclobacteriaceae bacterium]|nr:AI-2E family transporter [Cyclobacteriaceae bacterium]
MKRIEKFDKLDYIYKLLMVLALVITAILLAKDIVVPILISIILSVVLLPIIKRLEKKISPTLSILVVLIGSFLLFMFLGWLIVNQVSALVQDLPDIESKFNVFVDKLSNTLKQTFGMNALEQKQFLKDGITSLSTYTTDLLAATTSILGLLIQVPIYIFLFLIYRDRFRAFILKLLPDDQEIMWKKDFENVIQGYISGLSLVTLIIAALNSIGLLALGINHAIFFGILSGLLTIIPYVGIFIGAALPVLMALLTKDSLWYPVGVVIIFSVVQFLEGNFITPRITGSRVSINALAAILALLIGGKILGIAGMILAIPALGILKIILSYTHHLKPFVILIEDTPLDKDKGDPAKDLLP